MPKANYHILLIITGSVAAYKSLDLIRLLAKKNIMTTCVMTKSAQEFITPLSVASISGQPVYTDLFSLKDETQMGHIRLSREADLIVIAPASANILAKLSHGIADDLASTLLLASNKPVLIAPAMNSCMWEHPAVQRNVKTLRSDGMFFIGPDAGELACKEEGDGRMSEPDAIVKIILKHLQS